jgi:hypothetical protein
MASRSVFEECVRGCCIWQVVCFPCSSAGAEGFGKQVLAIDLSVTSIELESWRVHRRFDLSTLFSCTELT